MTKTSGKRRPLILPEVFLDGKVSQYCGDVLTVLRTLPADHFDCVVTSPPYWGLRDYGTGRWDGGNPLHEHDTVGARGGSGAPGKQTEGSFPSRFPAKACQCGAVYVDTQIGMEPTLAEHIAVMVEVFRDVRRTLKPTGVCWINYGDCYATAPNGRSAADTKAKGSDDRTFRDKPFSTIGPIYDPNHRPSGSIRSRGHNSGSKQTADNINVPVGRVVAGGYLKSKDLCMVPERLFIALQDDGWWVRSKLPWIKRNGMPESITDRPANSLEQIAMLTKSERYWYDADAVRKPASASTNARVAQNTAAQTGSTRANGGAKTNGNMKAVVRKPGVTPKSADEDTNIKAKASFHASTTEVLHDRNFRNTDLFFSSLEIPFGLISDADGTPLAIDANPQGFSEAHFATFPPALIEPLIKAGSPAGGCCSACGRPWMQAIEREVLPPPDRINNNAFKHASTTTRGTGKHTLRNIVRRRRGDWSADCDCDADTEPARVLDIFGGSGTTAMVAVSLGRRATLIELNPEYAILARARIESAFMGREEGKRHMVKQLGKTVDAGPLFGGSDAP